MPKRTSAADRDADPRRHRDDGQPSRLRRQTWPGNVRELRAAVERAILFEDPALLALGNGPDSTDAPGEVETFDPDIPFRMAKQRAADRWERGWVRELMSRAKGNLSEASRMARMDRSHLRTLLRKYGLRGQDETGEGCPFAGWRFEPHLEAPASIARALPPRHIAIPRRSPGRARAVHRRPPPPCDSEDRRPMHPLVPDMFRGLRSFVRRQPPSGGG